MKAEGVMVGEGSRAELQESFVDRTGYIFRDLVSF